MKHNKEVRVIAEIAILVSVAVILEIVFEIIFAPVFINGGSISPAMLPIFVIGYRHGLKPGLFSGLIMAVILLLFKGIAYIGAIPETSYLGPMWLKALMMILLDYIIPFTLLGIVGIFKDGLKKPKIFITGMVLASLIRYLSHSLSGIIVWTAEDSSAIWIYSLLTYNLTYMVGSLIFCIVVGYILLKRGLLTVNLDIR